MTANLKNALWLAAIAAPACMVYAYNYQPAPPVVEVYGSEHATVKSVAITKKLNKHAIDCLTDNLYHEARGEGEKGMIAVANVTLNRVKSGKFPNDVCKVVYQPNQFSWVGRVDQVDDEASYRKAQSIAMKALDGKTPKLVGNAEYYINPDKVNIKRHQWIKQLEPVKKIGNHQFYKDKSI
jgi:N-acetylmuramoyl-L-alanine amidase